MTIHVCTFCRGFFYGYPESTRYCYACKASTVMPVDVVEYNFDYSGSMSKASTSGPIFDDRVKDHGKKVSPRSGAMPKKKSSRKAPSIKGRKKLTLGMGVWAFLTGRPLRA